MAIEIKKLEQEAEDLRMAFAKGGILMFKNAVDSKYVLPIRCRFHKNSRKRFKKEK